MKNIFRSLYPFMYMLILIPHFLNGENPKKLAYLVSDVRIPFWEIMSKGIKNRALELGYKLDVYSADNIAKKELENSIKAIRSRVDGIILSPTNSSASVTILKLAKSNHIPVVIADIGTDGGEFVSYISSDNLSGAYKIGKVLTKEMLKLGWENGKVGIISIPQKRRNGQLRTEGFMKALDEDKIRGAGIKQQVTFSYEETYRYSLEFIEENSDLRAIWLQGSNRYKGALDAIRDKGKLGEILLVTFDAEPIFLNLIPQGILVGSAMQQPYLMGEDAVSIMDRYLKGDEVDRIVELPTLAISKDNIDEKLSIIKRNVLGIVEE